MPSIQLRFTRSFYYRHAFVGGLLAFFCTVMVLMMKQAGPLRWCAPVVFMGPWLILVLREYRLAARMMDEEGVTRCDGRRFLWPDLQRLVEVYKRMTPGQQGPLNHVDLLFTGGRVRILYMVIENGMEGIQFARRKMPGKVDDWRTRPLPQPAPARCAVCGGLGNYQSATQTVGHEEEDTSLPTAASALKVVQPVRHPDHGTGELKQCPECAAWFFYGDRAKPAAPACQTRRRKTLPPAQYRRPAK